MTADPGSLENLRDLAVPPPVPFWPPASGIWITLAGIVAMLAVIVWRRLQRYRADAYRRAALQELDAIAATSDADHTIERISTVLKRTALVAFPREDVASLSGQSWAAFLARSAGKDVDAGAFGRWLSGACHGGRESELTGLIDQARIWVRTHKPAHSSVSG